MGLFLIVRGRSATLQSAEKTHFSVSLNLEFAGACPP
jgi:hypothetical protein